MENKNINSNISKNIENNKEKNIEEKKNKKKLILINLSSKCNNNCIFCFNANKKNEDTFEEFKKKIDSINENEIKNYEIEFFGLECTIHDNFLKMISYLKNKNIHFIIVSNLRLLSYNKFCKFLKNSGLVTVYTSLHSCYPEIHDRITRTPKSFEQTIKGIKNCNEYNIRVLANTVICSLNYEHILKIEEFKNHLKIKTKISGLIVKEYVQNNIVVDYEKIKIKLNDAINYNFNNKIITVIEKMPLCLINNFKKVMIIKEKEIPFKELSMYLDICNKCSKKEICNGIMKRNYKLFGSSGINPI